ncbi:MAG: NgoFVII family restriction endonuclease, partial [Verrucomicrobiota bacterium]
MLDLFTEKSGVLDDADDNEVDLASQAYQVWKNATDRNPALKKTVPDMPNVLFATKPLSAVPVAPGKTASTGVMVYVRTADDNDALAWVDEAGRTVTESQHEILRAAACEPETPALTRLEKHHELVRTGVELVAAEQRSEGGALGRPSSARRRVYEHLKNYAESMRGTLFDIKPLHRAIESIFTRPLQEAARETLGRELRTGISDEKLADLVLALHEEDRLCVHEEDADTREPRIICSLGIKNT